MELMHRAVCIRRDIARHDNAAPDQTEVFEQSSPIGRVLTDSHC